MQKKEIISYLCQRIGASFKGISYVSFFLRIASCAKIAVEQVVACALAT